MAARHSGFYTGTKDYIIIGFGVDALNTVGGDVTAKRLVLGNNLTLVDPYAFWVAVGQSLFDSSVTINAEGIYSTSTGNVVHGSFHIVDRGTNTDRFTITSGGNVGLSTIAPTGRLHLPAGDVAASSAPLKFTSGTNMTTPENGAVEYDGTNLYITLGGTRYQLNQQTRYGVYNPTLTNVANLDASTAYECQYMCTGSTVSVSGRVDIDPTLTATSTQLGISLPIASNIGTTEDVGGVAFASGIAGQGAAILGDAVNDRAQLQYISGDVTNQAMYFMFQYQIL